MEPTVVYGKTDLGTNALTVARGTLAAPARQLLILMDGQRNVGELAGMFGADALARWIPQLESQGLVRRLAPAAAARNGLDTANTVPATGRGTVIRTTVISAPHARPATPRPAPTRPAAAPTSSRPAPVNRLALAALAVLVLAAAGGIWWFLRPAPVVEARAVPSSGTIVPAAPAAALPVQAAPPAFAKPPLRLRDSARAEARNAGTARAASEPAAPAPARAAAPRTAEKTPAAEPSPPPTVVPAATVPPPAAAPATASASAPGPLATPNPALPPPAIKPAPQAAVAPAPASAPVATAAPADAARPATLHPRDRVLPQLSRRARRAGVDSGRLVVRLHVTPRGTVERVEVVNANPPQIYDIEVQQSLMKWTFDPPGKSAVFPLELDFKP